MKIEINPNDFSASFNKEMPNLVNSKGVLLADFRRSIPPRYGVVWTAILSSHIFLGLVVFILAKGEVLLLPQQIGLVFCGAITLGFIFNFINFFLHEAVHFGLSKDKKWNDRLANIFVGPLIGQNVKVYRVIHWDHHLYLGEPGDPENAYLNPLDWKFIFETLFWIKTIKTLIGRAQHLKKDKLNETKNVSTLGPLIGTFIVHTTILIWAFWNTYYVLALTWVLGYSILPLIIAMRQLLEHRREDVDQGVDYFKNTHGACARMFGNDFLTRIGLGGVGFNRHLLHHWVPDVSYTRLSDLENFFEDTQMAETMRFRKTTYSKAFKSLFRLNK